jgi:hypothetical protein
VQGNADLAVSKPLGNDLRVHVRPEHVRVGTAEQRRIAAALERMGGIVSALTSKPIGRASDGGCPHEVFWLAAFQYERVEITWS